MPFRIRNTAILFVPASAILLCFTLLPPIPQDPAYQAFADARPLYGVANFWNVVTNLGFFAAALYGVPVLWSRTAFIEPWERIAYGCLLVGTAAIGVGSTIYHLRPDNSTLFWDRLPMTMVFMSLLAATVGERAGMKAGKLLLLPMILVGLGAVCYWSISGDLRLYVLVQFGSMLAIPILLAGFAPRYTGSGRIWCTVLLYAVAKVLELEDRRIASAFALGGHPLKHLAAAGALLVYVNAIAHRRPLQTSLATPEDSPPSGSRLCQGARR